MTVEQDASALSSEGYLELFEIDTTNIGGGDIFRFIPDGFDLTDVTWQNSVFTRFPISAEGFEWQGTTNAPPQPVLKLSNVNKVVLAAVITLGDIVGAKVTRWRTFEKYLDDQPQADPTAHFPEDIFFIQQKRTHSKLALEWSLSSALDIPGIKLPRRQILRDQTTGNLFAPGVGLIRFRGRY